MLLLGGQGQLIAFGLGQAARIQTPHSPPTRRTSPPLPRTDLHTMSAKLFAELRRGWSGGKPAGQGSLMHTYFGLPCWAPRPGYFPINMYRAIGVSWR